MGADTDVTLVKKGNGMTLNAPTPRHGDGTTRGFNTARERVPSGKRPQLRPCRASWLSADGMIHDQRFLIPALPLFEAAFCAFARGTLIDTENGPVAIEDLVPGDRVITAKSTPQPVTWIGATTLVPTHDNTDARVVPQYRILADAFGMSRPLSHMVAGPSAHVLGASGETLSPISALEDGVNVSRLTPPSPVDMFHLCLPEHGLIRVGGMLFESYHPGHGALRDIGPAMRDLFLKIFPQIHHVTDFGLMVYPRDPEPKTDATAA